MQEDVFPSRTLMELQNTGLQLIEEYEKQTVILLGGAIGFMDLRETLTTAIAIRTSWQNHQLYHSQAGAGIVASSMKRNGGSL
jgi:anthranilate synthase component 1